MSFTDYLRLNEHQIFKNIRSSLPSGIKKTQNLLVIKSDVIYVWKLQDNCVLTLNIKAVRNREVDEVNYQTLLPTSPPLFNPELLRVNNSETLLVVAGLCGVLVLELPSRSPPYGAFANNKEVIYCRNYSLDERLLMCNQLVEVRQVRFHPGSLNDTHIVVLTSDNIVRLYNITNATAIAIAAYPVGRMPYGVIPGTKASFLGAFGESAIDFDFGPAEVKKDDVQQSQLKLFKTHFDNPKKAIEGPKDSSTQSDVTDQFPPLKKSGNWKDLCWIMYLLRGDGVVYAINIDLNNPKLAPTLKGPIPMPTYEKVDSVHDACAIICLPTTPPVVAIAISNGIIYHSVVLPISEEEIVKLQAQNKSIKNIPDRCFYTFESIELELGLSVTSSDPEYSCPIFLHKDESRSERYFSTHQAGVHCITIPAVKGLQKFISGPEDGEPSVDLFTETSTAEYLICTKAASSEKVNPVIGFGIYYDSASVAAFLASGHFVSLSILTASLTPDNSFDYTDSSEIVKSPLKEMLKEPFDVYIQKILKQGTTQPILKLAPSPTRTHKESLELLQRAAQVFREEYFKSHNKAREEIEKRVKALQLFKKYQMEEVEKMNQEKQILQEKAEYLAEKYEDIKDKQDELSKRCEKVLVLISQKKEEPSDEEKKFIKELNKAEEKIKNYSKAIEKIKMKQKYQSLQMENWKNHNNSKSINLNEVQVTTMKSNLQDMTNKITELINDVKGYKTILGLK